MAEKIYSSKVVELGGQVKDFIAAANMIIMFDEAMALPELRDACVMHTGNELTGMIKPGDIYKIAGTEFKILRLNSTAAKANCSKAPFTSKASPFPTSAPAT